MPGQAALAGMPQKMPKDSEAAVTNGGLGEFDIGVLNARAGVREGGDGEVLEKVKRLLEDLERRANENDNGKATGEQMDET